MSNKDLTQYCRETNDTHKSVTEKEFRNLWCKRCRNQQCRFSTWGESSWLNRMDTQADRLLDNPLFGDPRQEQFRHLQSISFEDMKHQAVAMHLANQNQDWEIPSEKKVSEIINGADTLIGKTISNNGVTSISSTETEEIEEIPPLTEKVEQPKKSSESLVETLIRPAPSISHNANTEINDGGIIIGDDPVSVSPSVVVDDWSIPAPVGNIIPVGGRVRMGSSKGEKK